MLWKITHTCMSSYVIFFRRLLERWRFSFFSCLYTSIQPQHTPIKLDIFIVNDLVQWSCSPQYSCSPHPYWTPSPFESVPSLTWNSSSLTHLLSLLTFEAPWSQRQGRRAEHTSSSKELKASSLQLVPAHCNTSFAVHSAVAAGSTAIWKLWSSTTLDTACLSIARLGCQCRSLYT